ncbi:MAG: hypothetical protein RQ855_04495 [Desulfurococcales archaeon]|nr:hypothetical protein [Desulfurococcales archaeon]
MLRGSLCLLAWATTSFVAVCVKNIFLGYSILKIYESRSIPNPIDRSIYRVIELNREIYKSVVPKIYIVGLRSYEQHN